ncbi:MAG: SDR family oxidoreductase [Gammaproteobacteria bacterium]|nr:SDR family oxidoreductase [Gammaproteobacteria bacterium]
MMSIDHTGKSVIVTGAGSGIGRASALAFAECGASVVVNDINVDLARETLSLVQEQGGTATVFMADITDPKKIDELVLFACDTYGKLDVMFNNAGGSFPTAMLDVPLEDYRNIMALNIDSVYYGTMAALKVMVPQRSGIILSTTSGAGINAMPGLAIYGIAKAGVISLMKSVATEYGRQGIRANSISPGAMETPGLVNWLKTLSGGVQGYSDAQPQGRLGRPEEIAGAAVCLASDHASFVNGSMLAVDGAVHSTLWNPLAGML